MHHVCVCVDGVARLSFPAITAHTTHVFAHADVPPQAYNDMGIVNVNIRISIFPFSSKCFDSEAGLVQTDYVTLLELMASTHAWPLSNAELRARLLTRWLTMDEAFFFSDS